MKDLSEVMNYKEEHSTTSSNMSLNSGAPGAPGAPDVPGVVNAPSTLDVPSLSLPPIEANNCNSAPSCLVTPLPGIGERRKYRKVVQPFAAHSHDYYVIGLVEEGERTLICNGHPFTLKPQDMIVFNPGDVHSCEQSSETLFAYDSIAVEAEFLHYVKLTSPKVQNNRITLVFRKILKAIDAKDFSHIAESISQLCELLIDKRSPGVANHLHEDAAHRVLARFYGHLAETPSLSNLAKDEQLSTYSLIRAYKECFSITPMKHLTSLRVECAAKLLRSGVDPTTVAAEVGFADQAHLTRSFKQRMGVTPASYQRMTRDDGRHQ